jgi:hypothetical protein
VEKLDLKKTLKFLYDAKPEPRMVEVPPLQFLMVDGAGDPNTAAEYAEAVGALYSLGYTLKFKAKKELGVDYPVMALEGLWWADDMHDFSVARKADWKWTMMLSTPDFVTPELVEAARAEAGRKKPSAALNRLRFATFTEGLAGQVMHTGPYAAEAPTIQRLHEFIHGQGYTFDGLEQKHHEIYISDPRRSVPEKMNTIIRQAVRVR